MVGKEWTQTIQHTHTHTPYVCMCMYDGLQSGFIILILWRGDVLTLSYLPKVMWVVRGVGEKGGSMESNLTGWSDHKFLTGHVMVCGHAPGMYLFSKRFIFAWSKPCPLFLCIQVTQLWNNHPQASTITLATSLSSNPYLTFSHFQLIFLTSLLNSKCTKEAEKLLFLGALEILLSGICHQFGSNKLIKVL